MLLNITSGPLLSGLNGIMDIMGKLWKAPVLAPEELTAVYKNKKHVEKIFVEIEKGRDDK